METETRKPIKIRIVPEHIGLRIVMSETNIDMTGLIVPWNVINEWYKLGIQIAQCKKSHLN